MMVMASVMTLSCKGFLEPKSENEFVPTTVQALDEMLLYESYAKSTSNTNPFFDFLSDDTAVVRFSGSESNIITQVHLASLKALFSWQPDAYRVLEEDNVDESVYDAYSACYSRILGSNAVLDYIDTVEGKPDARNKLKAEALALRGFWYFNLVNIYGQPYNYDKTALGVPLHLVSKVSSTSIARNTVGEVYDQVLADLTESERLYMSLPQDLQWKADMRASLPFVQLLLSRVYLYMEEWELASSYADRVIQDGRFSLIQEASFPQDGTWMYFHSYANPEVIWPYGNASFFRDFMDPWMLDNTKGGKIAFVVADATLVKLFDEHDIRSRLYLMPDKRSAHYKAYSKLAVTGGDDIPDTSNRFARSLRLSEAYLNKAEAEAMLYHEGSGDEHKAEAVRLLNLLWSKRVSDLPETYLDDRSSAKLVESVRNERRRELCFEDHRWFDLRRYGMPRIVHTWMGDKNDNQITPYTLKAEDPMYTMQIPTSAMLRNDKLVQNPAGPVRVD